jgi:hypothetical protein
MDTTGSGSASREIGESTSPRCDGLGARTARPPVQSRRDGILRALVLIDTSSAKRVRKPVLPWRLESRPPWGGGSRAVQPGRVAFKPPAQEEPVRKRKAVRRWASRLDLYLASTASKSGRFLGPQTGRSAPRVATRSRNFCRIRNSSTGPRWFCDPSPSLPCSRSNLPPSFAATRTISF